MQRTETFHYFSIYCAVGGDICFCIKSKLLVHIIPFYHFRDIATFNSFMVNIKKLENWLKQIYPEDTEISVRFEAIAQKYHHLPINVFRKELQKATSQTSKTEEMKKKLMQAFSSDRRIVGECEADISSEGACVATYKKLEQLIRSDKRNILFNSADQGYVLKHLKPIMKRKGSFIKCLQDIEIKMSLSHK